MNALSSDEADELVRAGRGGSGIHGPNGWMRRANHRNSAGKAKAGRDDKKLAAINEHLSRHPRDGVSRAHADRLTKVQS